MWTRSSHQSIHSATHSTQGAPDYISRSENMPHQRHDATWSVKLGSLWSGSVSESTHLVGISGQVSGVIKANLHVVLSNLLSPVVGTRDDHTINKKLKRGLEVTLFSKHPIHLW